MKFSEFKTAVNAGLGPFSLRTGDGMSDLRDSSIVHGMVDVQRYIKGLQIGNKLSFQSDKLTLNGYASMGRLPNVTATKWSIVENVEVDSIEIIHPDPLSLESGVYSKTNLSWIANEVTTELGETEYVATAGDSITAGIGLTAIAVSQDASEGDRVLLTNTVSGQTIMCVVSAPGSVNTIYWLQVGSIMLHYTGGEWIAEPLSWSKPDYRIEITPNNIDGGATPVTSRFEFYGSDTLLYSMDADSITSPTQGVWVAENGQTVVPETVIPSCNRYELNWVPWSSSQAMTCGSMPESTYCYSFQQGRFIVHPAITSGTRLEIEYSGIKFTFSDDDELPEAWDDASAAEAISEYVLSKLVRTYDEDPSARRRAQDHFAEYQRLRKNLFVSLK